MKTQILITYLYVYILWGHVKGKRKMWCVCVCVRSPGDPAGCEEGESSAVQVQSKVLPRGCFWGAHPGDHTEALLPAGTERPRDHSACQDVFVIRSTEITRPWGWHMVENWAMTYNSVSRILASSRWEFGNCQVIKLEWNLMCGFTS